MQHISQKTIKQVQEEHAGQWLAIDGVENIAIGLFKDKLCIKVFSSRKPSELRAEISLNVEVYPVIIEQTGTFRALDQH